MRRVFVLLVLAAASAAAQSPDLSAPLTTDTAIVRGQLPNGLHYLIRRNTEPQRRTELRLVVNAGSILEDDAQRGVAHFVEHMAFDGTARFPKSAIVNFLERAGMQFGADVNAYTSFDETVYMLQVPTDTAQLVSTALDILEDWAHALTFDPAEMAKERDVVIEEWRTGRDASTRVSNRQFPVMLQGSKYATRLPIGTLENLEHFPDSVAVRFYHDWYRPDLMTVVAVGDFDPRAIEQGIRERFSRIPAPAHPPERTYAAVPDHDATLVSIEKDPEYPMSSVDLLWLKPADTTRTVGDFRRDLVESFYDGMVNSRLREIAQRPDAPFAFASTGHGGFVRTKDAYQMEAGVKESGFVRAAEALLDEAERVERFGFTSGELDRQRANLLRALEQQYAERDKTNSARFAGQYVSSALSGSPPIGIGERLRLARLLAPTITLAEVDAVARATTTDRDRVVLAAGPDKPNVKLPDAAAMRAVFDQAKSTVLTAYVDSTSSAPLVRHPPTPGTIVGERSLAGTGITEWTLSNGARVLLKPTDFKADEVLFAGDSPGGSSLLPDGDVINADLSSAVMSISGVGEFNAITLGKKLTGIRASASASLGDLNESVRGSASVRDLRTMFELAWLRFVEPRVDTSAYAAFRNRMRAYLANQHNSPEGVFSDTIELTMAGHNPRVRLLEPALLDSVSLGRALAIWRDRFADASGFTFALVGSFSVDSVRPLVEQWLASLPARRRNERGRDVGIRPPAGVVTRVVRKGVEPKAETRLVFTGPCRYSWENREVIGALRQLLDIRLREVLREDKGGTYGVDVGASCSRLPYQHYEIDIGFGSAPERVDELVASAFGVIDEIKAGTISDSNLTKIREIQLRAHETALRQNGSWLAAILDADEDGRDQGEFLRYPDLVEHLTKDEIRDAARAYLRKEQYARFTLLPEATPANPSGMRPAGPPW